MGMQLPSLHAPKERRLEQVLQRLVEVAKKDPRKQQKFASFKWKSLEHIKSAQVLKDALQATLECIVSNEDVEVICSQYRSQTKEFNYASFLLDFTNQYEQPKSFNQTQKKPTSICKPSHDRVLELWRTTRHQAVAISAANGFIASIEEKSRQRALLALEEALKKRLASRFQVNLHRMESLGHVARSDFRS